MSPATPDFANDDGEITKMALVRDVYVADTMERAHEKFEKRP